MEQVAAVEEEENVLVGKELLEQLRVVFDACDTEGQGMISMEELANISRSHVGRGQVDQILEILGPGEENQDMIDFDKFYQKFVEFMNNGEKGMEDNIEVMEHKEVTRSRKVNLSPMKDSGVFNENLKRAFEKEDAPRVVLKNVRRKSSLARLSGRIPLVNTSSEDEAEDSFDRKIASSLAMARPMDIQPQFLVRGTTTRSTVKKSSNPSPNISTSTRIFSTSSRPSPTSTVRMSPILAPSDGSSYNSPMSSSSTPCSRSGSFSPEDKEVGVRLALGDLERKVGQLTEMADRQEDKEYDSPSSGVGSIRAELEEEINSSIFLARKHGEERLGVERRRNAEQMKTLERERDLERRNFQLRFEQHQEDQDRIRREVDDLKRKLKLVNLEKEHLEEHISQLEKQNRCEVAIDAVRDSKEEQKRKDKEQELMMTVQRLTARVQSQDQDLAETKEDNIVLRSQVKCLKGGKQCREGGRFKIFGGGKETPSDDANYEDPCDIRIKLRLLEEELDDQKAANIELKEYVGEVLANIIEKTPQILEKVQRK